MTGTNNLRQGVKCFITSFALNLQKLVVLITNGHIQSREIMTLKILIKKYVFTSDDVVTNAKRKIVVIIFMQEFLIAINLNFSVPRAYQFISVHTDNT
jgi:hypothetical protein